jgi:hypothetical protein
MCVMMMEQNTDTQTEIAAVAREIFAITPGKRSPISQRLLIHTSVSWATVN